MRPAAVDSGGDLIADLGIIAGTFASSNATVFEEAVEDGFESKSLGLAGAVEAVLGDAFPARWWAPPSGIRRRTSR
jgi:hypothetical protein